MQRDLHFTDSLFGTGSGLFFLGALLAQVPSNLILVRIGARRTIAGLMVLWGATSATMAFIHTPFAFLALRFLLGVAEAGFYPGVIFYLTLWLPRRVRTSFVAWFLFAIPMASIFGGPLSSWVLAHGHVGRFADWQLLLLTEALPALCLGLLLPLLMTDSPDTATWLTPHHRNLLQQARDADEPPPEAIGTDKESTALNAPAIKHILLFATIYFTLQFGLYAQSFWLPRILQGFGIPTSAVGWHVSIVYIAAAIIMLAWGRVVDTAPTRRWTLTVPLLLSAAGYALAALSPHSTPIILAAFSLGAAGALAATPPFWAQVTLGQRSAAIAAMIAIINALGNIGGFAGPAVLGHLLQATGGYSTGMLIAGGAIALATVLFLAKSTSPQPPGPRSH